MLVHVLKLFNQCFVLGLCDYQHDLGHDAVMQPWIREFYSQLKGYFPHIQTDNLKANFIPRWAVSLMKNDDKPNENGGINIRKQTIFKTISSDFHRIFIFV